MGTFTSHTVMFFTFVIFIFLLLCILGIFRFTRQLATRQEKCSCLITVSTQFLPM